MEEENREGFIVNIILNGYSLGEMFFEKLPSKIPLPSPEELNLEVGKHKVEITVVSTDGMQQYYGKSKLVVKDEKDKKKDKLKLNIKKPVRNFKVNDKDQRIPLVFEIKGGVAPYNYTVLVNNKIIGGDKNIQSLNDKNQIELGFGINIESIKEALLKSKKEHVIELRVSDSLGKEIIGSTKFFYEFEEEVKGKQKIEIEILTPTKEILFEESKFMSYKIIIKSDKELEEIGYGIAIDDIQVKADKLFPKEKEIIIKDTFNLTQSKRRLEDEHYISINLEDKDKNHYAELNKFKVKFSKEKKDFGSKEIKDSKEVLKTIKELLSDPKLTNSKQMAIVIKKGLDRHHVNRLKELNQGLIKVLNHLESDNEWKKNNQKLLNKFEQVVRTYNFHFESLNKKYMTKRNLISNYLKRLNKTIKKDTGWKFEDAFEKPDKFIKFLNNPENKEAKNIQISFKRINDYLERVVGMFLVMWEDIEEIKKDFGDVLKTKI